MRDKGPAPNVSLIQRFYCIVKLYHHFVDRCVNYFVALYYCMYRGGFMLSEGVTLQQAWDEEADRKF